MVIAFGAVVFGADYGIPLIVGEISGIIFLLSDIIVAIDAVVQMVKKQR